MSQITISLQTLSLRAQTPVYTFCKCRLAFPCKAVPQQWSKRTHPKQRIDKYRVGSYSSESDYTPVIPLGCNLALKDPPEGFELATFAGGMFYGLQLVFERITGVYDTSVGYTQGRLHYPIFALVLSGTSGHTFAVQILFNPEEVSYEQLLDEYFAHLDPTSLNKQRNRVGTCYRSGIYFHNEDQEKQAVAKLKEIQQLIDEVNFRETEGKEVVVEVKAAEDFYIGETYHQHFFERGERGGPLQRSWKGCKDPIIWHDETIKF